MQLSSEIFVMVIFLIGVPIILFTLHESDLPEHRFFMAAYILLAFSNIFTVVEEFWLGAFFNFLEHLFITIASFVFFIAVIRMTSRQKSVSQPDTGEVRDW